SASSCGSLKKLAPGFSELREYAGAYHGTDIFVARPLSTEQVLLWLDSIIGCEAASAGQGEGPASPSGTP
ncbi:MAG: hypothetical protein JXR94_01800, partial [Candidatus Hydrogenedentes bacterium]|nr:hypothetical protein [Candidatus Hydrogenedentota bacterium]